MHTSSIPLCCVYLFLISSRYHLIKCHLLHFSFFSLQFIQNYVTLIYVNVSVRMGTLYGNERKITVFSTPHIAAMLLIVVLVFTCCKWAKSWSQQAINRFFRFVAIIILFFDPTYWTWEWITYGTIDTALSLPLYICSLFWILLPIAVYSREGICKRASISCLSTVCILGGIMGIVFNPHVGKYPFFSFVPLYSFTYHFMILLVGSLLWTTRYYKPKHIDRYLCMAPVIILVLINIPLNRRFGWDYCFTGGGIGTPFEILSSRVPLGIFLIILYGGMALLVGFGFYSLVFRKLEAENILITNRKVK